MVFMPRVLGGSRLAFTDNTVILAGSVPVEFLPCHEKTPATWADEFAVLRVVEFSPGMRLSGSIYTAVQRNGYSHEL